MIRDNRECVEALLTLAKQTKNYACENEIAFQLDIREMTEDLDNHKLDDINYLIERVGDSLMETSDKRTQLKLTTLNEIQIYVARD